MPKLRLSLMALRWIMIASLVGFMAGLSSALLLDALEYATSLRESHRWLILLLPLAGLGTGWMYHGFGRRVERGNNLILEEIHQPSETIPLRMTPLILVGTFVTHLFGGSAGREGTAVQMGASLADQLGKPLRLGPLGRRVLLMSGISAGFASVFGVPLAGTIFGLEVLSLGSVTYEAIGPCMLASFIGDLTTRLIYTHHAHYLVREIPWLNLKGIASAMLAGAVFGLVARGFAWSTHAVARLLSRFVSFAPLRPFFGGVIVSTAVFTLGTTKYIGLGTSTIAASFITKLPFYDFAAKAVFTAITLGSGFKGGEVTPLFFIGSTLGNALASLLPLSPSLLAGMGLVAVFAGAANAPIASTLMGMELFGSEAGAYCGIACVVSYLCSGHSGIYTSQRIGKRKGLHGLDVAVVSSAIMAKSEIE